MAISKYFRKGIQTEQRLVESLQIEAIQIYGNNVYYLPRTVNGFDQILNEDAESQFNSAWLIEMYPEDVTGFQGQGDLMSKFGLEIRDEITLIVAKRVWEKWVGVNTSRPNVRPDEGDIIFLPWSKSYFEITFVEHEEPWYQMMDLPVYKLRCSLFELNGEKFNTGFREIDAMAKERATRTRMQLSNVNGIFELGERIHQVVNLEPPVMIDGELVEWNRSTNEIAVIDIATSDNGLNNEIRTNYAMFTPDQPIHGTKSGAVANVANVYGLADTVNHAIDNSGSTDTDQNWNFALFDDSFLDFTEENPFGDPEGDGY